jgi:hypothetical protein
VGGPHHEADVSDLASAWDIAMLELWLRHLRTMPRNESSAPSPCALPLRG